MAPGSARPGRCGVGAAGRQWEGSAPEMCRRRTAAEGWSLAGRAEPQPGRHNHPSLPRWARAAVGRGWCVAQSRLPLMAASRPLPNPAGAPHPRVAPRMTPRARRGLPDKHPGRVSPRWGGHVPLHDTPAFTPRRQRRRTPGWMLHLGNHNPQPFPSPGMFFPKHVPLHQSWLGVRPDPGGCGLLAGAALPASFPSAPVPSGETRSPPHRRLLGEPPHCPVPPPLPLPLPCGCAVLHRVSLNRSSLENPVLPSHQEPLQVTRLGAGSRAGELGPPSRRGSDPARVSRRANADTGVRI